MAEQNTLAPAACLAPTPVVDFEHPEVRAFAERHAGGGDDTARACALYYAVRDGIRYDPYTIDLTFAGSRASQVLALGRGWCVTKAVLLAACCRAQGIPAALGYADVRNHLSTARMRESMGTDVYIWHGYTAIWLHGAWVKATPAFNRELCDKFRIRTLEFDGGADSIYHPYDLDGRQHMEYVAYRGEFPDVPLARMAEDFRAFYPTLAGGTAGDADFEREVEIETAQGRSAVAGR
jgi:transglutaminase-like putative cysteine protease